MENLLTWLADNWQILTLVFGLGNFALLWYLSRFFANKKDLESHLTDYSQHKLHFGNLERTVQELNQSVRNLPDVQEMSLMREEMALLRGRLEGSESLFKQILTNQNMLLENELRGEKK